MRERIQEIVEKHMGRGKPSGDGWLAFRCPFHKDGKEHNASFVVNLMAGFFTCHACHIAGPLVYLLKLLGLTETQVDEELAGVSETLKLLEEERKWANDNRWIDRDPLKAELTLKESVLSKYKKKVPDRLLKAGFQENWLRYLEIGVDDDNMRIIYPIRDVYGNLAGCSGGAMYDGQLPKYRVYGGTRIDSRGESRISEYGDWFDLEYPNYKFNNRRHLWHYDKVYPALFRSSKDKYLVLVEGYKACMWTLQSGVPYCAAVMGSSITEGQKDLLLRLSTPFILFFDNDDPGRAACYKYGGELHLARGNVYVAEYPENKKQPDDLTADELKAAVFNPKPYIIYKEEYERKKAQNGTRRTT